MPPAEKVEKAYTLVSNFWKIALEQIRAFSQYMTLTEANRPISGLRETNLLLKPVTQMALAHTARMSLMKGFKWEDIIEKINQIDWSFDNELWFNILVVPSANKKMITGKEAIRAAGMVISYMTMGKDMTKEELTDVKEIISNAHNYENPKLPDII